MQKLAIDSGTENSTQLVGNIGEDFAAKFVERIGFEIVCKNFKVAIGRNSKDVAITGEIDIVAIDEEVLVFIEVKTRSSDSFATPETAVNLRKQRQIIRTAKRYRRIFHINAIAIRYDVISIILNEKKAPKIEHFQGFFTEEKYQKAYWHTDER
jgi:putative endonuclease